jgi:DNA-binding NarL/FixJ family response regulator
LVLHITPWERAVLQLLADGTATEAIADRLGTNAREIETRLTTLFARMGAGGQTEAIAAAFRRGLLSSANDLSPAGGNRCPEHDQARSAR